MMKFNVLSKPQDVIIACTLAMYAALGSNFELILLSHLPHLIGFISRGSQRI